MRRFVSATTLVLAATLLSIGLTELVFVAFSISHPELSTEALWGGQQDEAARYERVTRVGGTGFRQPLLAPGVVEGEEFFGVEQEVTRFATEHGIPVYSLRPGFLGEDEESLWVASNDQHPNEKGHQIAADTLLPYLRAVLRGPPVPVDPR